MPPPSLELVSSALRPIPSDTHVPEIPTINAARLSHVGSNLTHAGGTTEMIMEREISTRVK